MAGQGSQRRAGIYREKTIVLSTMLMIKIALYSIVLHGETVEQGDADRIDPPCLQVYIYSVQYGSLAPPSGLFLARLDCRKSAGDVSFVDLILLGYDVLACGLGFCKASKQCRVTSSSILINSLTGVSSCTSKLVPMVSPMTPIAPELSLCQCCCIGCTVDRRCGASQHCERPELCTYVCVVNTSTRARIL